MTKTEQQLFRALKNLTLRCDGPEGVQGDGSNMDTIHAHLALDAAYAARVEELRGLGFDTSCAHDNASLELGWTV